MPVDSLLTAPESGALENGAHALIHYSPSADYRRFVATHSPMVS